MPTHYAQHAGRDNGLGRQDDGDSKWYCGHDHATTLPPYAQQEFIQTVNTWPHAVQSVVLRKREPCGSPTKTRTADRIQTTAILDHPGNLNLLCQGANAEIIFFESYGEHVKGCRQETDKLLTDSL